MILERHIIERNDYASSDRGTPLDEIKAFKRKHGYINLDNPHQKARYVSADSFAFNNSDKSNRAAGIRRSRIEHEQALGNLSTGKAALRRDDGQPKRRKGAGRPKVTTEMSTAKGQAVLDTMRAKGVFHGADWELSRGYLNTIMQDIRDLGYEINIIKTGMRASHYKLIDKQ